MKFQRQLGIVRRRTPPFRNLILITLLGTTFSFNKPLVFRYCCQLYDWPALLYYRSHSRSSTRRKLMKAASMLNLFNLPGLPWGTDGHDKVNIILLFFSTVAISEISMWPYLSCLSDFLGRTKCCRSRISSIWNCWFRRERSTPESTVRTIAYMLFLIVCLDNCGEFILNRSYKSTKVYIKTTYLSAIRGSFTLVLFLI